MRRKKFGKQIVNSSKVVYKDIKFESRLELYMYKLLELSGLHFGYEAQTFDVLEGFKDENSLLAKHNKSFIERGKRKVVGIKYTPDFLVYVNNEIKFVIETKGRPNESFPLRMKLFRKYLNNNNMKVDVFIPTNQQQCQITLKMIQDAVKEL